MPEEDLDAEKYFTQSPEESPNEKGPIFTLTEEISPRQHTTEAIRGHIRAIQKLCGQTPDGIIGARTFQDLQEYCTPLVAVGKLNDELLTNNQMLEELIAAAHKRIEQLEGEITSLKNELWEKK